MTLDSQRAISRRRALALMGGVAASAALTGLVGCGSQASDTRTGFASDCEVKSYPLTLHLIADENLSRGAARNDGYSRIEDYFEGYQGQNGRGQVTMAIKYMDAASMAIAATQGFEDCDGVIGLAGTIELAVSSGQLYGGAAETSVRKFTSQLYEQSVIVRAVGSDVEMPQASTATGEDSVDGQINRIQNLPSFAGTIAIGCDGLIEGVMANKVLARWGLYTETAGIGGEYAASIKDKITVFDAVDKIVNAVASKKCDIGFLARSCLLGDYSGVEKLYEPNYSDVVYYGASSVNAAEPGVARDFFEYITRTV